MTGPEAGKPELNWANNYVSAKMTSRWAAGDCTADYLLEDGEHNARRRL